MLLLLLVLVVLLLLVVSIVLLLRRGDLGKLVALVVVPVFFRTSHGLLLCNRLKRSHESKVGPFRSVVKAMKRRVQTSLGSLVYRCLPR